MKSHPRNPNSPLNQDVPVYVKVGDHWAVRVDRWWDDAAKMLRVKATPIQPGGVEGVGWEIPANEMPGYLAALRHVRELVFARSATLEAPLDAPGP